MSPRQLPGPLGIALSPCYVLSRQPIVAQLPPVRVGVCVVGVGGRWSSANYGVPLRPTDGQPASQGSHPLRALLFLLPLPLPSLSLLVCRPLCVQSVTRPGRASTKFLPYSPSPGASGSRPSSMVSFVMELAKDGNVGCNPDFNVFPRFQPLGHLASYIITFGPAQLGAPASIMHMLNDISSLSKASETRNLSLLSVCCSIPLL